MKITINGSKDSTLVFEITDELEVPGMVKVSITSYYAEDFTRSMIITPAELRYVMATIEALLQEVT